jgi:hypothetical protein
MKPAMLWENPIGEGLPIPEKRVGYFLPHLSVDFLLRKMLNRI